MLNLQATSTKSAYQTVATARLSADGRTLDSVPLRKVLLTAAACYFTYVLSVARLTDYGQLVKTFGDNAPYVAIANAIEHWDFSHLHVKLFWGLPYAMSVLSSVTKVGNLNSLLAISVLSSFVAVAQVWRLWGSWVALAFLILSREWLERSLLGGAEPLFLAFLFSGFWAARNERWALASFLAALATIVRPMGVFGLVAIGIVLLVRRNYRVLARAIAIGAGVGLLYIVPLKLYFGDSMANVKGYDHADWNSNSPVGLPFVAIVHDAFGGGATKLNLARTIVWVFFVLTSALVMLRGERGKEYAKNYPVEVFFWLLYLIFLVTYNSSWARAEFPRFAIPLVPFAAFAFDSWIPRRYWLLTILGLLAATLSAAETVGVVSTFLLLKRAL